MLIGESDHACPFCGSANVEARLHKGAYDCDSLYCNGCKTEYTLYPENIGIRWNRRAETDGEHCPFCGGDVEFDGVMNYRYMFADAYCPTCRIRIEFQGTNAVKSREKTIARARKAFARRAEVNHG